MLFNLQRTNVLGGGGGGDTRVYSALIFGIDIGERRIAGKQDGPSLIIDWPARTPPPPYNQKCLFFSILAHIYK